MALSYPFCSLPLVMVVLALYAGRVSPYSEPLPRLSYYTIYRIYGMLDLVYSLIGVALTFRSLSGQDELYPLFSYVLASSIPEFCLRLPLSYIFKPFEKPLFVIRSTFSVILYGAFMFFAVPFKIFAEIIVLESEDRYTLQQLRKRLYTMCLTLKIVK